MISNEARRLSSKFHVRYSQKTGQSAQDKFVKSCEAKKIKVSKSSPNQDKHQHIDFFMNGRSVDVKGLKKSHKQGLIILELKNVQGKNGWCHEDGPELLAFDFGGFFLIAKTTDLLKIIKKKCDVTNIVDRVGDCLYKGYSRNERSDLITMIKLGDVLDDSVEHWFLPAVE